MSLCCVCNWIDHSSPPPSLSVYMFTVSPKWRRTPFLGDRTPVPLTFTRPKRPAPVLLQYA